MLLPVTRAHYRAAATSALLKGLKIKEVKSGKYTSQWGCASCFLPLIYPSSFNPYNFSSFCCLGSFNFLLLYLKQI